MFSRTWLYYMAMLVDLLLRGLWVLTLVPSVQDLLGITNHNLSLYVNFILSWAELGRRTMWSMLRVENEHLFNTQGYRRVDYIPLFFETPIAPKKTFSSLWTKLALILELSMFFVAMVGVLVFAATNRL